MQVIFIAPLSIASNFFGEINQESSLQVSFLFHPSVVKGFQVSFTKKKLLIIDGRGFLQKIPNYLTFPYYRTLLLSLSLFILVIVKKMS